MSKLRDQVMALAAALPAHLASSIMNRVSTALVTKDKHNEEWALDVLERAGSHLRTVNAIMKPIVLSADIKMYLCPCPSCQTGKDILNIARASVWVRHLSVANRRQWRAFLYRQLRTAQQSPEVCRDARAAVVEVLLHGEEHLDPDTRQLLWLIASSAAEGTA